MSDTLLMETEDQLVARAQRALSRCNWEIGECAAQWTQRHARGRGDADFGALLGLSGDQIFQRRRVWETFADVYQNYPHLKWSHFYVVINWDDAAECLGWANEMEATVAEMKAWRRAQRGDDLTTPMEEDDELAGTPEYLTAAVGVVQDPRNFNGEGRRSFNEDAPFDDDPLESANDRIETAISAARESAGSDYAPFGKGARGPAPGEQKAERSDLSPEQVLKKVCSTLERSVAALTPEVLEEFSSMPIVLQQRLLDAVENLQARTAGLA